MDLSPQANPVVVLNEQRVKRGQDSGSHARRNMANGEAGDKKAKSRTALSYWPEDVEDDDNDGAEA